MKSLIQNEYIKLLAHPKMFFGYFIIALGGLGWIINFLFGLSEPDALLVAFGVIAAGFGAYAYVSINRSET